MRRAAALAWLRWGSTLRVGRCDGGRSFVSAAGAGDAAAAQASQDAPQKTNGVDSRADPSERRYSPLRIQMLSRNLHEQMFPGINVQYHTLDVSAAVSHLKSMGKWKEDQQPDNINDVVLTLPPLQGSSVAEHFANIGAEIAGDYLKLSEELAAEPLPPRPSQWLMRAGWTRYAPHADPVPVAHPRDDALVFDVETCVGDGEFATLAIAASREAWYCWVSPRLLDGSVPHTAAHLLIPLGKMDRPRIVAGHFVSYDRARIREEYSLTDSRMRFVDTLSMHMTVAGLSGQQRAVKLAADRKDLDKKSDSEIITSDVEPASAAAGAAVGEEEGIDVDDSGFVEALLEDDPKSQPLKSKPPEINSLERLRMEYCNLPLKKDRRNMFVKGTLDDIRKDFESLADYCAEDVAATHEVYRALFPLFRQQCPHPVSFAGMLEMGSAMLTVDESWPAYVRNAEAVYSAKNKEIEDILVSLANTAAERAHDPTVCDDPWLQGLDWTIKEARMTKAKTNAKGNVTLPARPHKRGSRGVGKPMWYVDLLDPKTDTLRLTTRMTIAPLLLRLMWNGYPLQHAGKEGGWCYRVPTQAAQELIKAGKSPVERAGDGWRLFRLPHKDHEGQNVGNPLGKEFMTYIADKTLTAETNSAKKALEVGAECSYWASARKRIKEQLVVWLDEIGEQVPLANHHVTRGEAGAVDRAIGGATQSVDCRKRVGVIIPRMLASGTITRRAVEPTWLTASNAKANRVGSELKSKIVAPLGQCIVGADVDSQELWIGSVLGDAYFARMHGGTAIGYMTLQGKKSDKTDVHSDSATVLNIKRDDAKIFNYGRMYGAGESYAARLLTKFNNMSKADAEAKARDLYRRTKGRRLHAVPDAVRNRLWRDLNFEIPHETTKSFAEDVNEFIRQHPEKDKLYWSGLPHRRRVWQGGTESHMFNALEDIATIDPRTPVLKCGVTSSLREPNIKQNEHITTRINWVVQSSAVDYLHLMLVSMRWLCAHYGIRARFAISIHDEVRYYSAEEDASRTALALHVTNLWTRCMFAHSLGINDLPLNVAFFSAVDVDRVLRKEVDMTCLTPSNPLKVEKGYTLDIYNAIQRTGGSLVGHAPAPITAATGNDGDAIPIRNGLGDTVATIATPASFQGIDRLDISQSGHAVIMLVAHPNANGTESNLARSAEERTIGESGVSSAKDVVAASTSCANAGVRVVDGADSDAESTPSAMKRRAKKSAVLDASVVDGAGTGAESTPSATKRRVKKSAVLDASAMDGAGIGAESTPSATKRRAKKSAVADASVVDGAATSAESTPTKRRAKKSAVLGAGSAPTFSDE